MKNKNLDGTIYGWLWAIGWCFVCFGSAMWIATSGIQASELLGNPRPNGAVLVAISAPVLTVIGLLTLGARWVLKPKV